MSIIPINDRRRLSPGDRIWEPIELMNTFLDFPPPSLVLSHHFPSLFPSSSSSTVETQLNWTETATAHVFKAYLPRVTHEDEAIVFVDDEGYLQICSGDNKFMSRFKLPNNALTDQVTAWMEDEFLVVFVAKDDSSTALPPQLPEIEENRNVRVVEITGDDD